MDAFTGAFSCAGASAWKFPSFNLLIFADLSIFLLTQHIFAVDSELKITYRSLFLTI